MQLRGNYCKGCPNKHRKYATYTFNSREIFSAFFVEEYGILKSTSI